MEYLATISCAQSYRLLQTGETGRFEFWEEAERPLLALRSFADGRLNGRNEATMNSALIPSY